jgi:hypothetical protein
MIREVVRVRGGGKDILSGREVISIYWEKKRP